MSYIEDKNYFKKVAFNKHRRKEVFLVDDDSLDKLITVSRRLMLPINDTDRVILQKAVDQLIGEMKSKSLRSYLESTQGPGQSLSLNQ